MRAKSCGMTWTSDWMEKRLNGTWFCSSNTKRRVRPTSKLLVLSPPCLQRLVLIGQINDLWLCEYQGVFWLSVYGLWHCDTNGDSLENLIYCWLNDALIALILYVTCGCSNIGYMLLFLKFHRPIEFLHACWKWLFRPLLWLPEKGLPVFPRFVCWIRIHGPGSTNAQSRVSLKAFFRPYGPKFYQIWVALLLE